MRRVSPSPFQVLYSPPRIIETVISPVCITNIFPLFAAPVIDKSMKDLKIQFTEVKKQLQRLQEENKSLKQGSSKNLQISTSGFITPFRRSQEPLQKESTRDLSSKQNQLVEQLDQLYYYLQQQYSAYQEMMKVAKQEYERVTENFTQQLKMQTTKTEQLQIALDKKISSEKALLNQLQELDIRLRQAKVTEDKLREELNKRMRTDSQQSIMSRKGSNVIMTTVPKQHNEPLNRYYDESSKPEIKQLKQDLQNLLRHRMIPIHPDRATQSSLSNEEFIEKYESLLAEMKHQTTPENKSDMSGLTHSPKQKKDNSLRKINETHNSPKITRTTRTQSQRNVAELDQPPMMMAVKHTQEKDFSFRAGAVMGMDSTLAQDLANLRKELIDQGQLKDRIDQLQSQIQELEKQVLLRDATLQEKENEIYLLKAGGSNNNQVALESLEQEINQKVKEYQKMQQLLDESEKQKKQKEDKIKDLQSVIQAQSITSDRWTNQIKSLQKERDEALQQLNRIKNVDLMELIDRNRQLENHLEIKQDQLDQLRSDFKIDIENKLREMDSLNQQQIKNIQNLEDANRTLVDKFASSQQENQSLFNQLQDEKKNSAIIKSQIQTAQLEILRLQNQEDQLRGVIDQQNQLLESKNVMAELLDKSSQTLPGLQFANLQTDSPQFNTPKFNSDLEKNLKLQEERNLQLEREVRELNKHLTKFRSRSQDFQMQMIEAQLIKDFSQNDKHQIENLKNQNRNLNATLNEKETQNRELQQVFSDLIQNIGQKEQEIQQIQNDLNSIMKENDKLRAEQQQKEQQIRQLKDNVLNAEQQADNKLKQQEKKLKQLEEQVQQLKKQIQERDYKISEITDQLKELEDARSTLMQSIQELESERQSQLDISLHDDKLSSLEQLEKQIAELQANKTKLNQKLEEKNKLIAELKDKVAQTNKSNQLNEIKLRDMTKQIEILKQEVVTLEQQKQEKKIKHKELKQKLIDKEVELQQLRFEIERLKFEVLRKEQDSEQQNTKIQKLQKDNQDISRQAQAELKNHTTQIQNKLKEIEQLNHKINEQTADIEQLNRRIDELLENNKDLQSNLDNQKDENKRTLQQLKQKEKDMEAIENHNKAQQRSLKQLTEQLESQLKEIANLRQQLSSRQAELQSLVDQLSQSERQRQLVEIEKEEYIQLCQKQLLMHENCESRDLNQQKVIQDLQRELDMLRNPPNSNSNEEFLQDQGENDQMKEEERIAELESYLNQMKENLEEQLQINRQNQLEVEYLQVERKQNTQTIANLEEQLDIKSRLCEELMDKWKMAERFLDMEQQQSSMEQTANQEKDKQIKELQNQIAELQSQLKELEDRTKQYEDQMKKLQADLQDKDMQLQDSQDKCKASVDKLQKILSQLDTAQQNQAQQQSILEELDQEGLPSEVELDRLENNVEKKEENLTDLKMLKDKISTLAEIYMPLPEQAQDQVGSLQHLDNLESILKDFQTKLDELQKMVAEGEKRTEDLEASLSKSKEQFRTLNKSSKKTENEKNKLTDEIICLKNQLQEYKNDIQEYFNEGQQLQMEKEALEEQVQSKDEKIKELEDQIERLKLQGPQNGDFQQSQSQVSEASTKSQIDREINESREKDREIQELKEKIEQLEKDKMDLFMRVSDLDSERSELQQTVDKLEQQLKEVRDELDELKKQKQDLENLLPVQEDVMILQGEIDNFEKQCSQVKELTQQKDQQYLSDVEKLLREIESLKDIIHSQEQQIREQMQQIVQNNDVDHSEVSELQEKVQNREGEIRELINRLDAQEQINEGQQKDLDELVQLLKDTQQNVVDMEQKFKDQADKNQEELQILVDALQEERLLNKQLEEKKSRLERELRFIQQTRESKKVTYSEESWRQMIEEYEQRIEELSYQLRITTESYEIISKERVMYQTAIQKISGAKNSDDLSQLVIKLMTEIRVLKERLAKMSEENSRLERLI